MEKELKIKRSYTCSRFGFDFSIFINGTTTSAILTGKDYMDFEHFYVGVARLKGDDKYDRELGKLIAMKSAINKYQAHITGKLSRKIAGFKGQVKFYKDILDNEIESRRELQPEQTIMSVHSEPEKLTLVKRIKSEHKANKVSQPTMDLRSIRNKLMTLFMKAGRKGIAKSKLGGRIRHSRPAQRDVVLEQLLKENLIKSWKKGKGTVYSLNFKNVEVTHATKYA